MREEEELSSTERRSSSIIPAETGSCPAGRDGVFFLHEKGDEAVV